MKMPNRCFWGADDPEVAITYSTYDRCRVQLKARHVADAIRIMYENTEMQRPITWLACCEQACANSYHQKKRGRTIADWYLELHQTALCSSVGQTTAICGHYGQITYV